MKTKLKKPLKKMDAEDLADLKKGIKQSPAEEIADKKNKTPDVLGMLASRAPAKK